MALATLEKPATAADRNAAEPVVVLEQALSRQQAKAALDAEGYLSVVIAVSLATLLDLDLEALNDHVERRILQEKSGGFLEDITYRVVGHRSVEPPLYCSGEVLIRVDGRVSFLF